MSCAAAGDQSGPPWDAVSLSEISSDLSSWEEPHQCPHSRFLERVKHGLQKSLERPSFSSSC